MSGSSWDQPLPTAGPSEDSPAEFSPSQPEAPVETPSGQELSDSDAEEWAEEEDEVTEPSSSRMPLILGTVGLVLIVWICVGVYAFVNPTVPETAPTVATDGPDPGPRASVASFSPTWSRPDWADTTPGMTAFELPAANDVPFANGRLRPSLGVSCDPEGTQLYVITGGTAIVDPELSGHVVHLEFDDSVDVSQHWTAAPDMRTLFAPDPVAMAEAVERADRLRFGFSHYMSGPTVVEFDLRGADEVLRSMVEPCGWDRAEG